MRKYLHKYTALSAFTEDYNSEAYHEPWVSLVTENKQVDYNKNDAPVTEITWNYMYDEVRVNNLGITCEDLDESNSGKTYPVKVNVIHHPEGDYSFDSTIEFVGVSSDVAKWRVKDTGIDCECGDGEIWFYIPS